MISNRLVRVAVPALLCAAIAACGGGGSGGGSSGGRGGGSGSGSSGGNSSAAALKADAGRDQNVKTGTQVRLDGRASGGADNRSLQFGWKFVSRPKSSNAALDDNRRVTPTFTADVDGEYTVRLQITNGQAASKPDTVKITSTSAAANSAPVADAGDDRNVATGLAVNLDGGASQDADSDALGYAWKLVSMPDGSGTALVNESTQTPVFTPDLAGAYEVQLTVNDGRAMSKPDMVRIVAAQSNSAPVADAGADRNINVGGTAKLDGSASSDANGDPLTYAWRLVARPPKSSAKLADAAGETPSLAADKEGDYLIGLTVNDGQTDSAEDRVVVSAGPAIALFVDAGSGRGFVPIRGYKAPTIRVNPNAKNQQLSRLQLRAIGQDYTIQNLQTVAIQNEKQTDDIQPYFGNELSDPMTVKADKPVTFTTNVRSIPASGSYTLGFRFKVKETGQVFTFSYGVEVQ